MKITPEIKSAFYWFTLDTLKGNLESELWDFDSEWFESGRLSWARYQEAILDPTIMGTTVSIWMNNLSKKGLKDEELVENALFRAHQYLRVHFDSEFNMDKINPSFEDWEMKEFQF